MAAQIAEELAPIAIDRAPGPDGVRASVEIAPVDAGQGSDAVLAAADDAMSAQQRAR